MADFILNKGDLRDNLKIQITDGGNIVDLTNANSVTFKLADLLSKTMTITDAVNGRCEYEWQSGDTDLEPGIYYCQFVVKWSDDDPETFPRQDNEFELEITGDVDV